MWALQDYGFAAVVSPGFADIFRNNCTKAGLVPVQVDPAVGRALLDAVAADPGLEITIDVERGTLDAPAAGIETTFPMDEFTRARLLNGWDDIGLSLRHEDEIEAYEADRQPWLPTTALSGDRAGPCHPPVDPTPDGRHRESRHRWFALRWCSRRIGAPTPGGRRARRVPGADYHEGQGGSQRRGTRWMMRYGSLPCARTFELVSPAGRLVGQTNCLFRLVR